MRIEAPGQVLSQTSITIHRSPTVGNERPAVAFARPDRVSAATIVFAQPALVIVAVRDVGIAPISVAL